MMTSRLSAEPRIVRANSVCSASSRVSISRLLKPMTPFIGVRISWLIAARNSLFARLAASASSRASAICCVGVDARERFIERMAELTQLVIGRHALERVQVAGPALLDGGADAIHRPQHVMLQLAPGRERAAPRPRRTDRSRPASRRG